MSARLMVKVSAIEVDRAMRRTGSHDYDMEIDLSDWPTFDVPADLLRLKEHIEEYLETSYS